MNLLARVKLVNDLNEKKVCEYNGSSATDIAFFLKKLIQSSLSSSDEDGLAEVSKRPVSLCLGIRRLVNPSISSKKHSCAGLEGTVARSCERPPTVSFKTAAIGDTWVVVVLVVVSMSVMLTAGVVDNTSTTVVAMTIAAVVVEGVAAMVVGGGAAIVVGGDVALVVRDGVQLVVGAAVALVVATFVVEAVTAILVGAGPT